MLTYGHCMRRVAWLIEGKEKAEPKLEIISAANACYDKVAMPIVM
jgi:hypothetical protein